MKKMSLKNLKLDASSLLQREQLKTVFGGYGMSGCSVTCQTGYYACCNDNTYTDDTCKCYEDGTTHSCDYGGSGSSYCSFDN